MFGGARETVAVVNKNARVAFRNAHVDDVTFLCRACVLRPRRTIEPCAIISFQQIFPSRNKSYSRRYSRIEREGNNREVSF